MTLPVTDLDVLPSLRLARVSVAAAIASASTGMVARFFTDGLGAYHTNAYVDDVLGH